MKKPLVFFFCSMILSLSLNISKAQNQIPFSVVSSGGGESLSAAHSINGTVGEAVIGVSANTTNQQYSGFWHMYLFNVITSAEDKTGGIPSVFKLEQNYPNPFNPVTIIRFAIPERSHVLIKVYDILGSEVITLLNEEKDIGWYEKEFNAAALTSGIYLYRLQAGNYVSIRKMMVLK